VGRSWFVPVLGVLIDAAGEVWHVVEKPLAEGRGSRGGWVTSLVARGFEPSGACWYTRKRLFERRVPAEAACDARLVGL